MNIFLLIFMIVLDLFLLYLGIDILVTKKFTFRSGVVATENEAIFIGTGLIILSCYAAFTITRHVIKVTRENKNLHNVECQCACHAGESIKHELPCCQKCQKCGKRIVLAGFREHMRLCGKEKQP